MLPITASRTVGPKRDGGNIGATLVKNQASQSKLMKTLKNWHCPPSKCEFAVESALWIGLSGKHSWKAMSFDPSVSFGNHVS